MQKEYRNKMKPNVGATMLVTSFTGVVRDKTFGSIVILSIAPPALQLNVI